MVKGPMRQTIILRKSSSMFLFQYNLSQSYAIHIFFLQVASTRLRISKMYAVFEKDTLICFKFKQNGLYALFP